MAQAFNTFGSVYIDGVPVKLSEKFKPLPKVTLPANFEMGNPTEVLFMEYDFSLEESVIAWSNERKKHIEQQKERERLLLEQQRKEQLLIKQQEEEQKALEKQAAAPPIGDQNSTDNVIKTEEESNDNIISPNEYENQSDRPSSNHGEAQDILPQSTESVSVSLHDMQVSHNMLPQSKQTVASNFSEKVPHTFLPHSTNQVRNFETIEPNQQIPTHNAFPPSAQTILATSQPSVPQTVFNKHQPVYYSVGQDILMPLPAAKPKVTSEKSSSGPSSFNPADFENEQDPFDNLELKTLDDLKELDKVLHNVQVGEKRQNAETGNVQFVPQVNSIVSTVPSVPPVGTSTGNFNAPINGYPQSGQYKLTEQPTESYNQQPIKNIQYSNMVYKNNQSIAGNSSTAIPANIRPVNINQMSGSVSYKAFNSTNSPQPSFNVGQPPTSSQPWNSPPSAQQLTTNTTLNSSNLYSGTTYSHTQVNNLSSNSLANSSQYTLAGSYNNPNSNVWVNPQNHNNSPHQPQQQQQPPPNQFQVWRDFLQKNSSTSSSSKNSEQFTNSSNYMMPNASMLGQINGYIGYMQQDQGIKDSGSRSQGHSRSNTPPPGMGKLRSARSTPDLAALVKNSENETPYQSRSPPVPRRMKSPPPSASFCDEKQGTNIKSTTLPNSNNIQSEVDPYRTMSGEARRFVDSLTNMGFRRITVSKAVQRIGIDEKTVLDFLCGLTRLKEKGLTEQEAEDILLLPEKDQKKAHDFLMLCKRFQEFGFKEDKVREGLLKCNLDEEKTLDWLTAN